MPLSVVAALLFVVGAGFSYGLGVQRPFLDALDQAVRGQAFAVLTTGLMTMQGVGPLLMGVVAQSLSTSAAMVVAGAGMASVGIVWWWYGRARHAFVMSPSAQRLG